MASGEHGGELSFFSSFIIRSVGVAFHCTHTHYTAISSSMFGFRDVEQYHKSEYNFFLVTFFPSFVWFYDLWDMPCSKCVPFFNLILSSRCRRWAFLHCQTDTFITYYYYYLSLWCSRLSSTFHPKRISSTDIRRARTHTQR